MKFQPMEPSKAVREEFLSEDKNFKLTVNHSLKNAPYAISTERIAILPGFGAGKTVAEAMETAKEGLVKQIGILQERVGQLEVMIEEEKSRGEAEALDTNEPTNQPT